MPLDKAGLPRRRSIRLAGFDYSLNSSYFVTVCSYRRECTFGIVDSAIHLSEPGKIVEEEWQRVAQRRGYVQLEASVVMPNHCHMLFTLMREGEDDRRGVARYARHCGAFKGPPPDSVGAIIRGFKSGVTRRARSELGIKGPIWQRGYFDRVVDSDKKFVAAWRYIEQNQARWLEDHYNPARRA